MIKILIVDDSALIRQILSDIFDADPEFEVVGTASDGSQAIEMAGSLRPDVITLDIEMPDMNGIDVVKKIMSTDPIPIVIISAHGKKDSDYSIKALEEGAVDVILKPSGEHSPDMHKVSGMILQKVKSAAKAHAKRFDVHEEEIHDFHPHKQKIVVMGSSIGGPQTLEFLFKMFPKDLPVPVLAVQHMASPLTTSLANRLDEVSEMRVIEAKDGMELENGTAYIAPGDKHMVVSENLDRKVISLNDDRLRQGVRPCIDNLFESAAQIYGDAVIGVVLTGMGKDGTQGSAAIKNKGGVIIAEAEESCVINGMPKSVIESGLADEILKLKDIPSSIFAFINR